MISCCSWSGSLRRDRPLRLPQAWPAGTDAVSFSHGRSRPWPCTAGGLWGWSPTTRTGRADACLVRAAAPRYIARDRRSPGHFAHGRRLVFVGHDATGKRLLYMLALDVGDPAQPLANTDGASLPFWAPNSQSVGFFGQGKLKNGYVETGQIRTLADAGGARGGTWNGDDVILFAPRPATGLYRISTAGGEPTPVRIDADRGVFPWFPSFLPDGRHFLFFSPAPGQPENAGVFVASLDSSDAKRLVTARSRAVRAAPGYLLFWREGALVAQAFDERTLDVHGNPVLVVKAVGLNPVTNQGLFSASDSGTLVFFGGAVGQSELVWVDRAGRPIGTLGPRVSSTAYPCHPTPRASSTIKPNHVTERSTCGASILPVAFLQADVPPVSRSVPALVARRQSHRVRLPSRPSAAVVRAECGQRGDRTLC